MVIRVMVKDVAVGVRARIGETARVTDSVLGLELSYRVMVRI